MTINLGMVRPGSTIYIPFDTFAGSTGASITMSDLAVGDIKIYKNGSVTERASTTGFTLLDTDGIDFDSLTGIHGVSIDLSSDATSGFYTAGGRYFVAISTITVDSQTVSFVAATFQIGYPDALINTTIATLSTQTSFTLTAGPAEASALIGCPVVIHDIASAVQLAYGIITAYAVTTKTVTLLTAPTFTVAAGDNISVFMPANSRWIGAALPANATIGTVSTLTGHTPQAGDSFTRIGPTGSGLTSLAQAAVATEARLAELDAANLPTDVAAVKTDTAAILTDTGTTLDNHLTDIKGTGFVADTHSLTNIEGYADLIDDATSGLAKIATDVAATLVDTNSLNDTKIPDTISLANIKTQADTALTDYDPPTRAELTTDTNSVLAILQGLVLVNGTIGSTGNDTTHLHLDGLTYGDDEINDHLLVIYDNSNSEYHARWISDWADTGDLATVATLPFTPEDAVDTYWLLPVRQDVSGGSGLDAAGVRAAVGLAAANLDTQLGTIDANVDLALADTNELQTDWADAGRLDTILDNRASQATADAIETDTQNIQTRLPAALVGGAMDSDVSNMQAGTITAAAIATDAVDADALAADAVTEIQSGLATVANQTAIEGKIDVVDANVDTLLTRITATLFSGITSIAGWLRLLARKDAAATTDWATELTEINVDGGSGAGGFVATTDSQEGIRDNTAWNTATGFSTHTAANVRTEMDANSTQLAAIVADTNELQTDWVNGGRLDLLIDAILADTGTDGVAVSTTVQQAIADEILKRGISNVEDTADATSIAALVLAAFESAISGMTWTIYKTDHSTTFATKTVTTDATADPIVEVD